MFEGIEEECVLTESASRGYEGYLEQQVVPLEKKE